MNPRRWLRWVVPLAILAAVLPIPVVSALEENDRFCIGCHTAPEVTYYNRAQSAVAGETPLVDLSSAHYAVEPFRCINCHRGDGGLTHRAATLGLGARDALLFITGQADQSLEKTKVVAPELLSAGCVTCHTDALLIAGFENHYHNKLPEAYAAWQAGGAITAAPGQPGPAPSELERYNTFVSCLDCHKAHHRSPGGELTNHLDIEADVLPACVQCHQEAGEGPLELTAP